MECSYLNQRLNFVFKDKIILCKMTYNPVIMTVFGIVCTLQFFWPLGFCQLNFIVINQHIDDFEYMLIFKRVLFLHDRVVLCRSDKLFLGSASISITSLSLHLNLQGGARVVVDSARCFPLSSTNNLDIDFSIISVCSCSSFHV